MSELLIIKNFGPINKADLEIKRYTVFIGKQASGKSTIAKLLAVFRSIDFVLESLQPNPNYGEIFKRYAIDNYFIYGSNNSTYLEYTSENYQIVFDTTSGWRFNKSEGYQSQVISANETFKASIKNFIENRPKESVGDEKELFDLLYNSPSKTRFIESLIGEKQTYIPADRVLYALIGENAFSLGNLPIPECLRKFGTAFEFARQSIKNFPVNFLNVSYVFEEGRNRIYYGEDRSLLLSESASGFQAVIPMMLVIENLKSSAGTFIVEEPELNLFPTTQKEIINFLVKSSNEDEKNDLVITTHSPYILSALNVLLLAFLTNEKASESRKEIIEVVEESAWISPNEFNAFYCSNGNVIEIFDRKLNLISENELDDVSEDIQGDFDSLMDLYTNTK